ncbi:MAG: hypothetical protein N3D16_12305 [Anaerolineales bacterium]|nr:hypothetical protein [Anaerolineales bacterium]
MLLALGLLACASAETEAPPLALPNTATSLPPSTPLPTQAAQIPEQRLLILEWPETIRVGDSDLILLTLEVDAEGNLTPTASIQGHQVKGEIFTVPNLYATHFVFAEGRLDISGLEVKPNPEIIESLQPGKRVKFAWSIRAEQVGNYRGMVWLHLVFKPKSGGIEERLALAAQRIDIRAVNLLGMSGNAARWMGVLGTLLGSLLSFDPIPALFGKLWKKKNECHPSRDQED